MAKYMYFCLLYIYIFCLIHYVLVKIITESSLSKPLQYFGFFALCGRGNINLRTEAELAVNLHADMR